MFTPDYDDAIGLAKHLNSEELKQLLNDDEKLEGMVRDLQQVKAVLSEKEMLIASNKSLAEYNLSLQPVLEKHRAELILLHEKAGELRTRVLAKKDEIVHTRSDNDSEVVLALLQTATAKAEEESEAHVQKLLDGEISLDEFLNEYIKKRTSAHVLRTKAEKMKALLLQNHYPASPPEKPVRARKAPLPPTPTSALPNLPYPSIPMPMPVIPNMYQTSVPHSEPSVAPVRQAPKPPPQVPQKSATGKAKLVALPHATRPNKKDPVPMPPAPSAYPPYPPFAPFVKVPLQN